MDAVVVIDKHQGPTSHDIVADVRRIFHQKRVGHAGTLDPLATGVLVVCVGKATRIVEYLVPEQKEYRAEMVLGMTSTSQDSTGETLSDVDASHVTLQMVEDVLPQFTGKILQVPPMVSAVKHEGKRLYELARKNIVVEREPREVQIYELEITGFEPGLHPVVGLRVVCSSGTYIRTLCADIGEVLGVGGLMQSLVRTRVGNFGIDKAISIEKLRQIAAEDRLGEVVISMDEALAGVPAVVADKTQAGVVANGGAIDSTLDGEDGMLVKVRDEDGNLLAVGRLRRCGDIATVAPEKVFAEACV